MGVFIFFSVTNLKVLIYSKVKHFDQIHIVEVIGTL